jgi:hypothetical protein
MIKEGIIWRLDIALQAHFVPLKKVYKHCRALLMTDIT